ncbi:MAG: penicillin-binding transpeptidase domain-containing protein [Mariprofundaceae bacterium]
MKHRVSNDVGIRRRIEFVGAVLAVGFLLLAVRAVDLQWFQAEVLQEKAERQWQRQIVVDAPRGSILDANGVVLAESIRTSAIAAISGKVPAERVGELASTLGMPVATLHKRLQARDGFVWLARQVSPEVADRITSLNIPGVHKEPAWRRYHPLGPESGHVLGFTGVDGHGLEGMEYSLNDLLTGRKGRGQVQLDARGNILPGRHWLQEPGKGEDVHLYLDATLQSHAYAALVDGVRQNRAKSGSVVVMRVRDGAVLAMANWPSYNPNNFSQYKPYQWRNRAVTDQFEPGSVLKPFTIAAALISGKWNKDSIIYCENGEYAVADTVIHDDHPEGWLDLTKLLVRSSNIGVAKLALDMGAEPLYRMINQVGLNRRTGIGLSGESPGMLRSLQHWGEVETATIAFGQGIAITPLQLATAFCVLANGGMYIQPRLIQKHAYSAPKRVMPEQTAAIIRTMLEQAVSSEGTGVQAVPVGYRVAGKTGTAQIPDHSSGGYYADRYTAVFAGMAPADNPELVIAVTITEPQKSIYGGKVAAPIFRQIAAAALPYLGIAPSVAPAPMIEQVKPWSAIPVALQRSGEGRDRMPSLIGKSLREVRRFAQASHIQLQVNGSGWVKRQKPAIFSTLPENRVVSVWLND